MWLFENSNFEMVCYMPLRIQNSYEHMVEFKKKKRLMMISERTQESEMDI